MKKPIVPKKKLKLKNLKLLDETPKQKVFDTLLRWPEKEFSLSDLAKEANVSKANIGAILNEFQKKDLIKIEKLSKIWRIRLNQTNWLGKKNKMIVNLSFIYNSGLVELLIEKYKNPKAIVLFGSYRNGEDISTSDIDLAIESDEIDDHQIISLKELSEFEVVIGRKIQIHFFNRKSIDTNLFNNIANGILLWGFLEVKK